MNRDECMDGANTSDRWAERLKLCQKKKIIAFVRNRCIRIWRLHSVYIWSLMLYVNLFKKRQLQQFSHLPSSQPAVHPATQRDALLYHDPSSVIKPQHYSCTNMSASEMGVTEAVLFLCRNTSHSKDHTEQRESNGTLGAVSLTSLMLSHHRLITRM